MRSQPRVVGMNSSKQDAHNTDDSNRAQYRQPLPLKALQQITFDMRQEDFERAIDGFTVVELRKVHSSFEGDKLFFEGEIHRLKKIGNSKDKIAPIANKIKIIRQKQGHLNLLIGEREPAHEDARIAALEAELIKRDETIASLMAQFSRANAVEPLITKPGGWIEERYVISKGKEYGPYLIERWRDGESVNGRRERYIGKMSA